MTTATHPAMAAANELDRDSDAAALEEPAEAGRPYRRWVRHLRNTALRARVPFFFMQWGGTVRGSRTLDGELWEQRPQPTGHVRAIA